MLENEALLGAMQQTEEDTIDVITYLKKQDQEKDRQVCLSNCCDILRKSQLKIILLFGGN